MKNYQQIIKVFNQFQKKKYKYLPVIACLIKDEKIYWKSDNSQRHVERSFPKELYYNATIIVNLEPCPACTFFLAQQKVKSIIFGAYNLNYGACGGKIHLLQKISQVHRPKIYGGINHKSISKVLSGNFRELFF